MRRRLGFSLKKLVNSAKKVAKKAAPIVKAAMKNPLVRKVAGQVAKKAVAVGGELVKKNFPAAAPLVNMATKVADKKIDQKVAHKRALGMGSVLNKFADKATQFAENKVVDTVANKVSKAHPMAAPLVGLVAKVGHAVINNKHK